MNKFGIGVYRVEVRLASEAETKKFIVHAGSPQIAVEKILKHSGFPGLRQITVSVIQGEIVE